MRREENLCHYFFLIFLFIIYLLFLFLAVLGLRFCVRAFSSCGEWGPLLIAVRGPRTIAASIVAEHRLQTLRLSSCGARAQLLRSMWDLPRPGLEPVSPALAGRFSTTAPPGKPLCHYLLTSHSTFSWLSKTPINIDWFYLYDFASKDIHILPGNACLWTWIWTNKA